MPPRGGQADPDRGARRAAPADGPRQQERSGEGAAELPPGAVRHPRQAGTVEEGGRCGRRSQPVSPTEKVGRRSETRQTVNRDFASVDEFLAEYVANISRT